VLAAGARNGPGIGTLILSNSLLAWQAPGSSTPGAAALVSGGGSFLLEDGADPSMWIRVSVYPTYLPSTAQGLVNIGDTFNSFGPDDVAAANAASGITETVEFTLKNVSPAVITGVKLWLDPAVVDLTVSSDGTNFYDPISSTDAHVLTWSSIAAGASVNLWVKRIIGASATSNPAILNLMQYSWNGV